MHAARDSSCFALVMHVASRSYATFAVAGNVLPLHTCLHVHCMSLACLLIFLSPFNFSLLFGVVFVAYCHDLLACACVSVCGRCRSCSCIMASCVLHGCQKCNVEHSARATACAVAVVNDHWLLLLLFVLKGARAWGI